MYKRPILLLALLLLVLAAFAESGEQGRDPTEPLDYHKPVAKPAAVKLHLSSVLISDQRKLAIINGHSLREGQIIPQSNGVKLMRIDSQGVVVADGGRQKVLRLAPSVIKRHP